MGEIRARVGIECASRTEMKVVSRHRAFGPLHWLLVALLVGLLGALKIGLELFRVPSGSMIPTIGIGEHVVALELAYGLRLPFQKEPLLTWGNPERGDVVVYRSPRDASLLHLHRVIAVGGDRVRVAGSAVFVNDQKLDRGEPEPLTYEESPGLDPADAPAVVSAQRFLEQAWRRPDRRYSVIYLPDVDRMNFARRIDDKEQGLECFDADEEGTECRVLPGYVFVLGDNRDNAADSRVLGGVPVRDVVGRVLGVD